MPFTDILTWGWHSLRPVENCMTLLTIFPSAFLCRLNSCVQVSALIHKMVEAMYSCHCIRNFFPPQGLFLSKAEMDVSLHSHALKALFQGMYWIWAWQGMWMTLITGLVSTVSDFRRDSQVNSWEIPLWALVPLAQAAAVHHAQGTVKCTVWTAVMSSVWTMYIFLLSSGVNLAPPAGNMFQNT